jgi:hypothetical protein
LLSDQRLRRPPARGCTSASKRAAPAAERHSTPAEHAYGVGANARSEAHTRCRRQCTGGRHLQGRPEGHQQRQNSGLPQLLPNVTADVTPSKPTAADSRRAQWVAFEEAAHGQRRGRDGVQNEHRCDLRRCAHPLHSPSGWARRSTRIFSKSTSIQPPTSNNTRNTSDKLSTYRWMTGMSTASSHSPGWCPLPEWSETLGRARCQSRRCSLAR